MIDGTGKRTIIRFIPFDEAPAVDVNDLAPLPVLAAQHVESTDPLTEPFADFGSPGGFLLGEVRYEAERKNVHENRD